MGYACPVCETPQADAVHLANHLAFTAIGRGGEHEDWLDEHVPEWGSLDESGLADRVTEYAAEVEFPQVFEDTTGQGRGGGGTHDHDHGGDHQRPEGRVPGAGDSLQAAIEMANLGGVDDLDDEDVRAILDEAMELTRERRTGDRDESETE